MVALSAALIGLALLIADEWQIVRKLDLILGAFSLYYPVGPWVRRFEPWRMAPRRVWRVGSAVANWRCTGGQGKAALQFLIDVALGA
jgi:hypothetical protein